MEREKKPEFVVTDRRKFNAEGEPRADAAVETSSLSPAAPAATPEQPQATQPRPTQPPPPQAAPTHAAPTHATSTTPDSPRQESASAFNPTSASSPGPDLATGYSGDRERASFGGQKMEFVHLLDMLVQTAMMYAGAMDTGTERRVDIVGLRQMIDLIAVLEEKTKGNLNEQEADILKNTIFQLRMTYMEIVNMIDREAMQKGPGAKGPGPTGPARK